MTRSRVRAATVLAATFTAAALASSPGAAQVADPRGPFVGIGVGVGDVRDSNLEDHRFGPLLHVRAGWALGGVAPMVEVNFSGLGDDEPLATDFAFVNPSIGGEPVMIRRPSVLSTVSVLASVQVGLPGAFYVRPGVGIGSHAFAVYRLDTDAPMAETSHEAGPAAGLAIGRTLSLSRRFPVAVEGVAYWTGGEDSTGSRWAAGIQVVPMIRF